MTCKEKLALEHPDMFEEGCYCGCIGCPDDYGYLKAPEGCKDRIPTKAYTFSEITEMCKECWNREMYTEESNAALDGCYSNATYVREPLRADDVLAPAEKDIFEMSPEEIKHGRILDSGNRREFETGAVRDIQEGKGRCDLLPLDVVACVCSEMIDDQYPYYTFVHLGKFQRTGDIKYLYDALNTANAKIFEQYTTMLLEVAKHFEEGCKKYGENNWQKGIPVKCYIDSAVRHYLKYLRGDKDEPHDRAFCWNILCAIWTCVHKPELNDYVKKGE